MYTNLQIPYDVGNGLISCGTIRFSRRTLLHGVSYLDIIQQQSVDTFHKMHLMILIYPANSSCQLMFTEVTNFLQLSPLEASSCSPGQEILFP
jgi:hypothetical protein